MYLILSPKEAHERNRKEAMKRGCNWVNAKFWQEIAVENGIALDVLDGEGLTKKELKECVESVTLKDGI